MISGVVLKRQEAVPRSVRRFTVDGTSGAESVASLFHDKYKELYNCVLFDAKHMAALNEDLVTRVNKHCSLIDCDTLLSNNKCNEHLITVSDVQEVVNNLKRGKHDGNQGHFSDHIINASPRLYVHLSLLFNNMLSHGFLPKEFEILLSTLVPIPKNRLKSLNNSDNYRAIALSSILGKLFDKILLSKCSHVFTTSDLQYGFKKNHSTNQCTLVMPVKLLTGFIM